MKHLLVIGLFLITWNEYALRSISPCPGPVQMSGGGWAQLSINCRESDIYTVEIATHSIKLKTQSDVDKFIPWVERFSKENPHSIIYHKGVIGEQAFNIKVKELDNKSESANDRLIVTPGQPYYTAPQEIHSIPVDEKDYLEKGKKDLEDLKK